MQRILVCGECGRQYDVGVVDRRDHGSNCVGWPAGVFGVSPLAIAGTSDKKYVYVVNSGSNDISAFAVDPGTGALTAVPGSPFAAGTNPRALALYEDSYLYVANSGSDDYIGLPGRPKQRSPYTIGILCQLFHATGAGPSAIAIHPRTMFLYTANAGGSQYFSVPNR